MKNYQKQKGFTVPLVWGIITLLVISLGSYVLIVQQQKPLTTKQAENTIAVTNDTSVNTQHTSSTTLSNTNNEIIISTTTSTADADFGSHVSTNKESSKMKSVILSNSVNKTPSASVSTSSKNKNSNVPDDYVDSSSIPHACSVVVHIVEQSTSSSEISFAIDSMNTINKGIDLTDISVCSNYNLNQIKKIEFSDSQIQTLRKLIKDGASANNSFNFTVEMNCGGICVNEWTLRSMNGVRPSSEIYFYDTNS